MAFCVFNLSKGQRHKLCYAITILLTFMIACGVFLVGYSAYMCYSISSSVFPDRTELNFVFIVVGLVGTHIIFVYALGYNLCYKCVNQSMKKSTRNLLFLWYLAGTNAVVDLVIICNSTRKEMIHVISSIKQSLEKGMRRYLRDQQWKQIIDRMQYKLECCGINDYRDWHEVVWINSYQINERSDLVKQLRIANESLILPVTPWSCCRTDFPMQCLHDPFQQLQSTHLWVDQPDLVLESINNKGCLNLLQSPVQLALIFIILISTITFILNIVIIAMTRILYTSYRNSILLEDPDGSAPGWVIGRGDCGFFRGPSLMDMVTVEAASYARRAQKETPSPSRSPKPPKSPKKKKGSANESVGQKESERSARSAQRSDEDPVSSEEETQLLLK